MYLIKVQYKCEEIVTIVLDVSYERDVVSGCMIWFTDKNAEDITQEELDTVKVCRRTVSTKALEELWRVGKDYREEN